VSSTRHPNSGLAPAQPVQSAAAPTPPVARPPRAHPADRLPFPRPASRHAVAPPTPSRPRPTRSAERAPTRYSPRLLAGLAGVGRSVSLAENERLHGQLSWSRFAGREGGARLVELIAEAGLRGRGGSGFPTARKIAAVFAASSRRRQVTVVANGCEGDPTSGKDATLLRQAPHLVLDGLVLAAHALGATRAVMCVHRGSPLISALQKALIERSDSPCPMHLATVPRRYVSSESSALARFLTSGDARPTGPLTRTASQGVHGRPTLVDNVETLAHLALIARHGADWFRRRGTLESPGTTLVTVSGAVHRPGVFEVDLGTHIGATLGMAGGASRPTEAILLGGLGGQWLPCTPSLGTALCYEGHRGITLGVPSLVVLPADICGLAVTSTILTYLAAESAGQCGPCKFGLPAVAADFAELVAARPDTALRERLHRRLRVIPGRGACSHPDGAVQLAASALHVFAADVAEHLAGRGCRRAPGSTLNLLRTLPASAGGWI
jgi:NADH:ubiquinone oxidoreductase subunit F (NADH-binding)